MNGYWTFNYTIKGVFTSIVAVFIPIIMAGNYILISVSALNVYLSFLVVASFFFFYFFLHLLRWNVSCVKVDNVFLILCFLIGWFISFSLLHYDGKSVPYIIIFLFFILLIMIFYNGISSFYKIFTSVILGTFFTIVRVLLETKGDVFEVTIHSRYDLDFVGGINNFAYIVTTAIILSYYKLKNFWLKWSAIAFFSTFNILTLSRGANLVLLFFYIYIMLFTKGVYKRVLVILFIGLFFIGALFSLDENIIARYDMLSDFEGSSDGRTTVWAYALSRIISIKGLVWGFGPGTYEQIVGRYIFTSTHNQYIDFIYSFGAFFSLPFFVVFFSYLIKCIKIIKRFECVFWLNLLYAISFMFDTRLWVIQTVWLFPLIIAYTLKCFKNAQYRLLY